MNGRNALITALREQLPQTQQKCTTVSRPGMRPPLDIARLLDLGFLDLGFLDLGFLDLGFRYLGSTISGSALATAFLFFTVPAMAAEVSADRLINADREPQR